MGLKIWTRSLEYPHEHLNIKIVTKVILFTYYTYKFSTNSYEFILNSLRSFTYFLAEVLMLYYDEKIIKELYN